MLKLKERVMKMAKDIFEIHSPYGKREQAVFGEMGQQMKAFMANKAYSFDNVIEKMKDLKKDFMEDGAISLSTGKLNKFIGKIKEVVATHYPDLANWQQTGLDKANDVIAGIQKDHGNADEITLSGEEIRDYVGKISKEIVGAVKTSQAVPESHFIAIDKINQLISDKLAYDLVKACEVDATAQPTNEVVEFQPLVPSL